MKYCPECGAEYRPGFDTCFDCQVGLVDEPPANDGSTSDPLRSKPVYQERVPVYG